MEQSPKVSVIIPVYNAEKYLRECLDSVVNQTLKEIEIICVDDGSTDNSLSILREYEAKDGRVKVLTQKNQYAGVARNNGMKVAKGEYLAFLDADDFFELNLLELQYTQCKQYDADISLCGADSFDVITQQFRPSPWLLSKEFVPYPVFSANDVSNNIFRITTPAPWNKMFSARFVKKYLLQFQNTQRANDLFFTWTALNLAEKITYIDQIFVHYRTGTSTNLQANNQNSPLDFYHAMLAVKERLELENMYANVEQGFINNFMEQCEYNLRTLGNPETDAFRLLTKKITSELFPLFKINEKSKDYFYDPIRFNHLMEQIKAAAPKVSVIVPVYNVENYLRQCLDSIVNQTLKDIEIICVNDGSTDNSLSILEEYAKKDARIKIIQKDFNEGLLLARKSGVLQATGQYIIFVDSDDYLDKNACQQAFNLIKIKNVDILQFTAGVEDYSNNISSKQWLEKALSPTNQHLSDDQILYHFYVTRKNFTSLWGKIYVTNLLKTAYSFIPDFHCYVGEDIFAQFYIGFFANTYEGFKTQPLYWYRYGLGVGNAQKASIEKFELYCKMGNLSNYIYQFLKDQNCIEAYQNAYEAMSERMLEDCCRIYQNRLLASDQAEGAQLLIQYWKNNSVTNRVFERALGCSLKQFIYEHVEIPVFVKKNTAFTDSIPKVSVIIPVYNVEKYLRECLDSVCNQTLKDIEIICVNDGSFDGSLEILEEYFQKDTRLTLISQKNGGQSSARNVALEHAHGKYILFLDSDDMLTPTATQELYEYAVKNNLDILFFNADVLYEDTALEKNFSSYQTYYHCKKDYHIPRSGQQLFVDLNYGREYRVSPCLQLIKTAHLKQNHIHFLDGIVHEDNLFTFQNLLLATQAACINKNYYIRRIRENSTMTSAKKFHHLYGYLKCYANMLSFVEQNILDDSTLPSVQAVIQSMHRDANKVFSQLSAEEKAKASKLNPIDQLWFKQVITDLSDKKTSSNKAISPSPVIRTGIDEAALIRASWSYKIGRFITWIPRKIRGGYRCYKEHGLVHTVERAFFHLGKVSERAFYYLGKLAGKLCEFLIWLVKKSQSGIRCCQEHGFKYTMRLALEKIRRKLK